MHALDTMRMESGFLHWGHDISPEENQYQAGLNFTISYKKDFNFIGREAVEKIKDKKIDRKFAMFVLKNNEPENLLCFMMNQFIKMIKSLEELHRAIILLTLKNLAFGYIKNDYSDNELLNGNISIEIEKIKFPAEIIFKPLKQTNFKNI